MPGEPVLRQLLLITDGCSNLGTDPVYVAQMGRERGIATSVIGVVDDGALGERGRTEARNIAEAGGGMCRIVRAADLAHTVQMVTRQTMQLTLGQVVNAELRGIIGGDADELPPETRSKVAGVVDRMSEEVVLELGLVIDVSASMASKMHAVREAIRDLEFGLKARTGESAMFVVTYPGEQGETAVLHRRIGSAGMIADVIGGLRPAGNTPTGPALELAIQTMLDGVAWHGSHQHHVV